MFLPLSQFLIRTALLATICLTPSFEGSEPNEKNNSVLVPICFGVVLLMGVGGDDSWGARTHEEYLIDVSHRRSFTFCFRGIV